MFSVQLSRWHPSAAIVVFSLAGALSSAAVAAPDDVVARVNGQPITEREVTIATEDLGGSFQAMPDEQRREAIINLLADVKIVAAAAARQKIDQGPEFAAQLAYLRDKALMQAFLDNAGKTAVSDAEVKKVYDDTVKTLAPEEEVRARHILLESEGDARLAADRLRKGEGFETVAREMSKDPGSAQEGGDLGFFGKDQMVPEFAEAAFQLAPGATSDPVKSQFGFHIIKVEEKRSKPVPELAEVRDQIETYLVRRSQQDEIRKLREAATIERVPAVPPPEGSAPAAPKP